MSSGTPATRLIRFGAFARLWWAGVVGSLGDWVAIFASLAVADSIAGGTGILALLLSRILPGLLFGAVVGVVTDRIDRKKLIVFADVGRGLLVPFLAFVDNLPMLLTISLALEFMSLLGQAPRAAVIPKLVGQDDIVTANSLMMGSAYGTLPLGAAAGLLLGALPALSFGGLIPPATEPVAMAFFFDAVTFLTSGVIVATLPSMAIDRHQQRATSHVRSTLKDLGDGGRFLWQHGRVRRVISGMSTALFGGGTVIVLGIPFVEDVLGADVQGFFAVVAALGLGAAAGIVAVSLYASRLERRDVVFSLSLMLTGLGLLAAAMTSTVPGAAGWMMVMGFGAGAAYVMGLSTLHEQVDDELRGRVFAALFTLMRIGLFLSMAVAVPIAGAMRSANLPDPFASPERNVLFAGGLIIILAGLGSIWGVRHTLRRPISEQARQVLEEASRASGSYPRVVRRSDRRRAAGLQSPQSLDDDGRPDGTVDGGGRGDEVPGARDPQYETRMEAE